jgi:hypothetical protein
MRIDAISIENIASLLGQQQVIDLRLGRSPVGGAGLIAITGPTGAGNRPSSIASAWPCSARRPVSKPVRASRAPS